MRGNHHHHQGQEHAHAHERAEAPARGRRSHDHAHEGHAAHAWETRIGVAVVLNVIFAVVEAIFGWRANSVALIADAGHNLSDVLGLLFAWGAIALTRRPARANFTYGLGRSSVLAALANAVLLLLACGALVWETMGRFAASPPVAGVTVMWVAGAGIAINGASAWLLHKGQQDMNMRAAFMHMLADAGISAGVVISGYMILRTGFQWIDPAVSLGVVAAILAGTWALLRDSLRLSLDGVPAGMDSESVRRFLATQPGVVGVHDLHIWALSTTSTALTAHLIVPDAGVGDALLDSLTPELKREFNIDHATLQIERGACEQDC